MAIDDTREALLDAVAVVLRRDGVGRLSLRRIAAEAGVSHGAPGALFGDRAEMISHFAARGFERLAASMEAEVAGAPDGRAALAASGRGYVAFALAEPDCFALMFRDEQLRSDLPALVAGRQRAFGVLAGAIQQAVGEGHVTSDRAPTVLLGAWSIVHGLAALWQSGALPPRLAAQAPSDLADAITQLFAYSAMPDPQG